MRPSKCVELTTIDGQIYCEVGRDYLLHVCDLDTYKKLSASQIVLLVNATVAEHMSRQVH